MVIQVAVLEKILSGTRKNHSSFINITLTKVFYSKNDIKYTYNYS